MAQQKHEWMSYSSPVCDMVHFIKKYELDGWEFVTAVQVDIRCKLIFKRPIETPTEL